MNVGHPNPPRKPMVLVYRGPVARCWKIATRLRRMGYTAEYVPPQGKRKGGVVVASYDWWPVSQVLRLAKEFSGGIPEIQCSECWNGLGPLCPEHKEDLDA